MPCLCYEPGDFTITGNGASILEHQSLTWLLTTDGLLGTAPDLAGMPNGNLNQLFWKLLQNDGAIVNFVYNAFSRTFGVSNTNAPAVNTIGPMPGAPTEPTHGAVHTVVFDDFEVTYRYNEDDTEWLEVARSDRAATLVKLHQKRVTIALESGDSEVPFAIPTIDSDGDAFAFVMDDLALLYINNADADLPVIGVVPGYNLSGAVVRVVLSAPIPADTSYELVAIFRRTVITN